MYQLVPDFQKPSVILTTLANTHMYGVSELEKNLEEYDQIWKRGNRWIKTLLINAFSVREGKTSRKCSFTKTPTLGHVIISGNSTFWKTNHWLLPHPLTWVLTLIWTGGLTHTKGQNPMVSSLRNAHSIEASVCYDDLSFMTKQLRRCPSYCSIYFNKILKKLILLHIFETKKAFM